MWPLEELKGDREVVTQAVRRHGFALEYAARELRGDADVVMEAVRQNGEALQCASEALTSAFCWSPSEPCAAFLWPWFPPFFRPHAAHVWSSRAAETGVSLKYIQYQEALKGRKDVVMLAVKQQGRVLQIASEEQAKQNTRNKQHQINNNKLMIKQ